MPSKPSISSVQPRPGDGPLIITLAAMLLINMTVFCVVVGFDDVKRDRPPSVTGPSAVAPSPATPSRTAATTHVSDRVAPTPRPVVGQAAPVDVSPSPVSATAQAQTPAAQADDGDGNGDDDAPLTFFGVPVH